MSNAERIILRTPVGHQSRSIAHAHAKIKKHGKDLKIPVIFAGGKVDITGLFISSHGWKQDSQT